MTTLSELIDRKRQTATDIDNILRKDKAKLKRERNKLKKQFLAASGLQEKLDIQKQIKEVDRNLREWMLSYYENYDRLEAEMFY